MSDQRRLCRITYMYIYIYILHADLTNTSVKVRKIGQYLLDGLIDQTVWKEAPDIFTVISPQVKRVHKDEEVSYELQQRLSRVMFPPLNYTGHHATLSKEFKERYKACRMC